MIRILILIGGLVAAFFLGRGVWHSISEKGGLLWSTTLGLIFTLIVVSFLGLSFAQPRVLEIFTFAFTGDRKADVIIRSAAKDPQEDPDTWPNKGAREIAQHVTEAEKAKYDLEKAEVLSKMTEAEAERACHSAPGSPERKNWDDAGVDPCKRALPSGVQAVASTDLSKLGKSLSKVGESLSRPLGTPPDGADPWLEQFYRVPAGVALFVGLFLLILVVGAQPRTRH